MKDKYYLIEGDKDYLLNHWRRDFPQGNLCAIMTLGPIALDWLPEINLGSIYLNACTHHRRCRFHWR